MYKGARLLGHCLILTFVMSVTPVSAGGGPKNVLVVVNDNSPTSVSIGNYYKAKRSIPDRNICHIRCLTDELVSKAECEANIVAPIRNYIASAGIEDRIDYIVLTKGIPLKASYNDGSWGGPVSVTSVLTCLGEPSITAPVVNPYGPLASPPSPVRYFSHDLSFNGKRYYIVTRLDAYTEAQVQRMIDDSVSAQARNDVMFVLDGRYESQPWSQYYQANDRLRQANRNLLNAGYATCYDDMTFDSMITQFASGKQNVMGYFSWGSNEASYSLAAYTSNLFVAGSIADTFVSTSGRTFSYPPSYGQSLIADLIPQGLSGGNGYVSEPQVGLQTYPNVLFDRYLRGYNMGESFFAATPRLYWKAVTIGDPLMAPYATPPSVNITSPQPDTILRGYVTIKASAWDASGIARVEFYIDDCLVDSLGTPPYEYVWNTAPSSEGRHVLEVVAYENSPVFTQNTARIEVEVQNRPLYVSSIGELNRLCAGMLVALDSKPVIAGADAFADCIYLSDTDGIGGIKLKDAARPPTGAIATVIGELGWEDGEKVIRVEWMSDGGLAQLPAPLCIPNCWVGNLPDTSAPETKRLRAGLSSAGLLVRTWGRVIEAKADSFVISDGSVRKPDGSEAGVEVSLRNLVNDFELPLVGSYVIVTGISSYRRDADGLLCPIIRPRFPVDIVLDAPRTHLVSTEGTVSAGWNFVSLPGVATDSSARGVFGDLLASGGLYYWDTITNQLMTYDDFNPSACAAIIPGRGFWLVSNSEGTVTTEILKDEPSSDVWISLPQSGYSVIGQPFDREVDVCRCYLTDGVDTLTMEEAMEQEWIEGALYHFDNVYSSMYRLELVAGASVRLEPWKAYWIKTRRPNLALIVPPGEHQQTQQ